MDYDESVHERRFKAAVKVMNSLPENGLFVPSDDMQRMFYSYYKQATSGPCSTRKPSGWDSTAKAKWEAWKALGNMSKEQAMKEYVEEIQLILETMPVTEEVADLLSVLEPFYELVEDEDDNMTEKPVISTLSSCRDLNRLSVGTLRPGMKDVPALTGSVSSQCESTHSSLNTEEEEEELECIRVADVCDAIEPKQRRDDWRQRSTAKEAGTARAQKMRGGSTVTHSVSLCENPGTAANPPLITHHQRVKHNILPRHDDTPGLNCPAGEETDSEFKKRNMNMQIAEALVHLHDDMQHVLEILDKLKVQKLLQVQSLSPPSNSVLHSLKRRLLWGEKHVSPIMLAFLLIWPFTVNGLVQLYIQRKRSRR